MSHLEKIQRLALVITLLSGSGCKDGPVHNVSRNDSAIIHKDTGVSKNGSAPNKLPDPAFPKEFTEFKKYFTKDSVVRFNEQAQIPISLVRFFFHNDLDTSYNPSADPDTLIENRFGYFFIVKVNCIAGGDCAVYYLLAFDKNGKFIKRKKLGILVAEEDETTYFKYKVISDTSLLTYKITDNEEKDQTDTIVKHVRLAR